jgi:imidazolonepropionase
MVKVFKNIDECLTLEGASKKEGRNISDADLSIVKDAAIVVKKNKIAWVGPTKNLPKEYKKVKAVSLKGKTVLPGFVECHTHMVYGGNRGNDFEMKFQGATYQDIAAAGGGIVSTVDHTRKVSESNLLKISEERAKNFLKQGVTTVEIKSGYGLNFKTEEKILKVANKIKSVRVVPTYLGPHSKPKEIDSLDKYMDQVLLDLKKIKKYSNRADIFIEKNYFTIDQAKKYFEAAKKLGFDIISHTNQLNPSEGARFSVQMGALSCDHLNYLSTQDMVVLAKSDTTCVFIPTADYYINVPFPPARQLIEQGARVSLSTDYNPGTSPTQDIQFVGLLARKEMKMTLSEVISAWTVGPSYALGLQAQIGSLEAGKDADFVVINSSWKDLFYQVGFNSVDHVVRSGKVIEV